MCDGLSCSYCQTEIINGQQISHCEDCGISSHVKCSHELQIDCIQSENEQPRKFINNENVKISKFESWVTIQKYANTY